MRRRWRTWLVAQVLGLLVIAALLLSALSATVPEVGDPLISCPGDVAVSNAEYGEGVRTGETPLEIALSTEWLDQLGVPEQARRSVSGATPEFGVVGVAPAADGVVTAGEEAGTEHSFLVFTDGEPTVQLFVSQTDKGDYWVSGVEHC